MEHRDFLDLMNQFVRIHNQFAAIKRTQVFTYDGENHFPAEMHVLTLLSRNPQLTISEIADSLYVTRSAASQMVKKLNVKGLITKQRNPENERIVNLQLSPKGSAALQVFIRFDSEAFLRFYRELSGTSAEEQAVVKKFLNILEAMFAQKLE